MEKTTTKKTDPKESPSRLKPPYKNYTSEELRGELTKRGASKVSHPAPGSNGYFSKTAMIRILEECDEGRTWDDIFAPGRSWRMGSAKGSRTKRPAADPSDKASPSPTSSRNLIYFGAPGTGKSHQLKEAVEGKLGDGGKVIQDEALAKPPGRGRA